MKSLGLPGFGRDNWQSRIRHFVRQHDDYRDMANWTDSETSDIVYDDRDNKFTTLLIASGHLNSQHWASGRPKYFIEVKTTTSSLDTPFFVSHNQFQDMEGMKLPEQSASNKVYLIARVFKLGVAGMGLKVYLDPARLRLDGELLFRTDKYEVTPVFRV